MTIGAIPIYRKKIRVNRVTTIDKSRFFSYIHTFEVTMDETFKTLIGGFVTRVLFKVLTGVFAWVGYTEESAVALIGALVAFLIELGMSWYHSKKVLNTPPPNQ